MAATTRTFSERELNRALLARQHLLRRSTASLPAMLESVGCIQMQYAPSGYVGTWSRLADTSRSRITRALERRQVVQATLLRSTIHLASAADYPVLFAATAQARQELGRKAARTRKLEEVDYGTLAAQVRGWFAGGPLERRELLDRLAAEGYGKDHWESLSQWLALLRVPPQGTWERRRAHLYGLARDELGAPRVPVDHEAAMALLVERYLGGFGPASLDDLSSWSGLPAGAFDDVLTRLELRRFTSGYDGDELLDLPRRPLPDASTPAPVRFLGTWDATLLVHARRTQVLPEDLRDQVFHIRRPHSVNTVLIDGQVAGTWTIERGAVVVEPFEGVPARFREELEAERAALEAFVS